MGRTVAAVAASAAAIAAYCAYSYYKKRRVIAAIRAMPKIELHVHLDGAFDADTLFKLSIARVDELPEAIASQIRACGTDINKFKALATCTGKEEQTLKAMIDKFVFFLPIVQGQYAYLEALAYRFVEGQALQNIENPMENYVFSAQELQNIKNPRKIQPQENQGFQTSGPPK